MKQAMSIRAKAAIGGALVGLALLALTVSPLLAQPPAPTPSKPSGPTSGPTITHEEMDSLMDAMHGEGTSQRMHEAMGPDAEKLIDQCVNMMNMMQNMQGMMDNANAQGMMGSGTFGMMGGQNGRAMLDMMGRLLGR